jgi:hypothetical protein
MLCSSRGSEEDPAQWSLKALLLSDKLTVQIIQDSELESDLVNTDISEWIESINVW